MNSQVSLESLELAKLNAEVIALAHSIMALAAVTEDVIATIDQGSFLVAYLGRGSEIFGLGLPEAFKTIERINYAKGLVKDLAKIKTNIEQNYINEVC